MTLPDPPLLVITDRRQAKRPLPEIVEAALVAGCRWISVREKDLPEAEQIALAESLLPLVRRFGARLTLHGDVLAAGSLDGLHLRDGSDPAPVRKRFGTDKLLGLSVHSVAAAAAVDPIQVDYLIAGPVYETQSKPGYGPTLGPSGLADLVLAAPVPVFAIGGISAGNIADVMEVGAAGVAVMGSVMRAADPEQEVRSLLSVLSAC